MNSLSISARRRRIAQIVQPGLLCAFDFDGTLAPIVTRPDMAYTPKNVVTRLNELAKYAAVAIITGRAVSDVRDRLGFVPEYILGNHGLEGLPGAEKHAVVYHELCQSWADTLNQQLACPSISQHNIWVEDKGYSLAVHYRLSRNHAEAEQVLTNIFAKTMPSARVVGGKFVYNLLPEDAGNKGSALEELIDFSNASSVLYIGDDITDEDVFRLRRPDLLSIRVGHDPHSNAELFLPHRLDVLQLLDDLIAQFRAIHPASHKLENGFVY